MLYEIFDFVWLALWCSVGIVAMGFLFALFLWGVGIINLYTQKEGTATAWLLGGQYCCTSLQYIEHHFDQSSDPILHDCIVPSRAADGAVTHGPNMSSHCVLMWRPLAGYIFYVRGLVAPAKYEEFSTKDDGFGETTNVLLHTLTKQLDMKKVDSRAGAHGGETTPLDMVAVFRMRIVNIYKFLFVAPKDAVPEAMVVMETLIRDLARMSTPDEIFDMKANSRTLWEKLEPIQTAPQQQQGQGQPVQTHQPAQAFVGSIKDLHDNWGIEIIPDKVAFRSISYQKDDEEAAASQRQQRMKAKGEASELLGSLLEIAAARLGVANAEEARKKLEETPEGRAKLDAMEAKAAETVFQRKKASAGGYKEFNIPGLHEAVTAILGAFGGGKKS